MLKVWKTQEGGLNCVFESLKLFLKTKSLQRVRTQKYKTENIKSEREREAHTKTILY
jgi:hypothetical protein